VRFLLVMLALSACDGERNGAPEASLPAEVSTGETGVIAEAASPLEASSDGAAPAETARAVVVRLLVGGVYHDYDTLPPALVSRVEAKGSVRVAITHDLATLEDLNAIDVLWLHTCHDIPLPAPALDSVKAFVARGGGLVSMHCGVASFRQTPEWAQLLGGIVWSHEPYGTFEVRVRSAHPTLAGVPATFSLTDEAYCVDGRAGDIEVLVETTRSLIGLDGGVRPGLEPQVWTRSHGSGRIFVLTFGHDAASQQNDAVVSIVHGGLMWAARRL
jgi:uncharacterized protein